jgi:type III secretory pathway lipoprotein EscJ
MENGWVKAYETSVPYQANIIQSVLTEHDIEAVIINKQNSALISIGKQEIYVPEEKLLRALQLINNDDTENGTEEEE